MQIGPRVRVLQPSGDLSASLLNVKESKRFIRENSRGGGPSVEVKAAREAVAASEGADATTCVATVAQPATVVSDAWAPRSFLSDEEAIEILEEHPSNLRPLLDRRGYRFVKRVFDVAASGVAIALLVIPSAVLCAAIVVKSPGASPIYSQKRVGRLNKDGSYRFFNMYKFRSMVPNAHAMLADLQEANEADGPMFKIKDDPRIIPGIGSFIRKHSIDELPQLVNVLKGDMSLVGPRPGLPKEVAVYDERATERLKVKPGCGGAWQVSGRSDVGFAEMVELDAEYIQRRSAAEDLRFIVGTIKAMFSGNGAA